MVRHVSKPKTPGWKAMLAVTVAAAGLLWHVLACTESPMAFSPSGKDLAFVTLTPYDGDALHLAGKHTCRLLIAREGAAVKVVERTDRHMLSAPAYSGDGKHLAYLRIPLLSEAAAEKLAEQAKEAREKRNPLPWPQEAAGADAAPDPEIEDLALPPLTREADFFKAALLGPMVPVEVVVRDAKAADVVVATVTVKLPVFDFTADKPGEGLLMTYLLTRPQYSPDGQWVHFCLGNVAVAVDPKARKLRMLAAPTALATLSPDGKTIAAAQEKAIAFIDTDGSRKTVVRRQDDLSPGGVVWADSKTLALLTSKDGRRRVVRLRLDGTEAGAIDLPGPTDKKFADVGELAVAPGAKHIVLCYQEEVLFLDGAGKLLRRVTDEKRPLGRPTFSPDGKRVAFKRFDKQGGQDAQKAGVVEIVYFSAEGKELSRVKVPPVEAPKAPAKN